MVAALDSGICVGVEAGGLSGVLSVVDDVEGPGGRRDRVVAQDDLLPDEEGIDLVEAAVQADGAIFVDAAPGLEEEDGVEVEGGVGVADACTGQRPLLEWRAPVDAAMGGVMILALDPGPEAAVERLQAVQGLSIEVAEPPCAKRPEVALDFSFPGGLVGPGMDEGNAELCADQGEVAGAVGGAVVDIKALGEPAADEGRS